MNKIGRHADYDQIAPTYDLRYERNSYAGVSRALLDFVGDQPRAAILEVGCGTGHWLEFLQERGFPAMGLDLSMRMLSIARTRLPTISFAQGTAHRLPWPSGSFDGLFCINAIHHFPEKLTFLTEARRVLRPGAQILIVGLDPHNGVDQWYVYNYFPESLEIDRQRYPAAESLRSWMREAGFSDCTTQEVEQWTYRLPSQEIRQQGRLEKASTSQLSVLTDPEYRRGVEKIHSDEERAKIRGETLFLAADLRLYGTLGKVL